MPGRDISPERKGVYYLGMALFGIGLTLFLSTFVSHFANFGDFTDFEDRAKTSMATAFGGMLCMGIGQFMMRLGRAGLAGSGLKLDPQEARRDLEPWSRMTGGMLKDTLDEADIDLRHPTNSSDLPFDEQLRKLDALQREGLITDAEHATSRQKILNSLGQ